MPATPSKANSVAPQQPAHIDHTQANNTNRGAHPLFTLPPAAHGKLAAAFAASQAAVEAVLADTAAMVRTQQQRQHVAPSQHAASLAAALLSDISTVDLNVSVPAVAALLARVEAEQRSMLMR